MKKKITILILTVENVFPAMIQPFVRLMAAKFTKIPFTILSLYNANFVLLRGVLIVLHLKHVNPLLVIAMKITISIEKIKNVTNVFSLDVPHVKLKVHVKSQAVTIQITIFMTLKLNHV